MKALAKHHFAKEEVETLRSQAVARLARQAVKAAQRKAAEQQVTDLPSALEELRVHGAELELQNEELQRARTTAEELQSRYFRHFDLAPVGMIRMDCNGIVLEANILGAAMLGVDRTRISIGKVPFAAYVPRESQTTLHLHLKQALEGPSPLAARNMESCELALKNRSGECTFVRMQTIVSIGATGTNDLLVSLTDLTEHRNLEGGLARQKDAAETATRAKDVFFAMLSHELRTPLTPALLLVEELEKTESLAPSARESLSVVKRNLKIEVHLIDDLLDLTRIIKGNLAIDREILDAHTCVGRALDTCVPAIEQADIEFRIDFTAKHQTVDADCRRLEQVISNLIRNAVKFTSPGGRISVRSFNKTPDRITFEFSDTGIGIDSTTIDAIFEPFVQGTPSIQGRFGGLGLGLAISRSLIQAQGGTLTAASPGVGQGSTFYLELPVIPLAPPFTTTSPPETATPKRRNNLRLLVVENHEDTRYALQRLLTSRGYQVDTADDASSAVNLCSETDYDLIVSDIGLPDRSGLELMKEVGQQHKIPGIAISGFGMDSDIAKSEAAGFHEHLTKPLDFEKLDAAIQRLATNNSQLIE